MSARHRQQIRAQLAVLEERIDELGALASATELHSLQSPANVSFGSDLLLQSALDSMSSLDRFFQDEQAHKSISADNFLQRVVGLLVQDATRLECDIAVSHFGEGKISMEMAELVMGAILGGIRASLKSHKGLSRAQRLRRHLFITGTVYLEVCATESEIQFRIIEDGQGFAGPELPDLGQEKQVQKLREHIAQCGGWFSHCPFEHNGSKIEFKVPVAQNRLQAVVLRQGAFEALLPSANIAECIEPEGESIIPAGALVLQLDEHGGLVPGNGDAAVRLRVGVADLQFWITCDAISTGVKTRRIPASGFVEEESWLRHFGVFQEVGTSRALPLLDGAALVHLHGICGGTR